MRPKEGVQAWAQGMLLMADRDGDTQLAYDYLDAWLDAATGRWLIENYGYGHSNARPSRASTRPSSTTSCSPTRSRRCPLLLHAQHAAEVQSAYVAMYERIKAGADGPAWTFARALRRRPGLAGWLLLARLLVLGRGCSCCPSPSSSRRASGRRSASTSTAPLLAQLRRPRRRRGRLPPDAPPQVAGISLLSALVVILVAFPVAWFIAFRVRRSRLTWVLLVTVPFWISYLLRIFSWKIVLGFGGALNSGLLASASSTPPSRR
jgi:hypothetical protein